MLGAWLFFVGPWVTFLFVLLACKCIYNICWWFHLGWCIEREACLRRIAQRQQQQHTL